MERAYRALGGLVGVLLGASPTGLPAFDDGVIEPDGETIEDEAVIGEGGSPLQGVVVRRTITRFGDEFYRSFARVWRRQELEAPRPIVVEEHPSAQDGSRVRVRYSGDVLFETTLRPHGPEPGQVGEQAANRIADRIERRMAAGLRNNHPDLAEEEL